MALLFAPPLLLLELSYTCALQQSPPPQDTHTHTHTTPICPYAPSSHLLSHNPNHFSSQFTSCISVSAALQRTILIQQAYNAHHPSRAPLLVSYYSYYYSCKRFCTFSCSSHYYLSPRFNFPLPPSHPKKERVEEQ